VGESESEKSDLTKRHQKTGIKKQPHPHTGNAKGMAKKQQQNKTTKHTIEFSNNTRQRGNPATVLRGTGTVNCTNRSQQGRRASLCRNYSTRSISAPRLARFSTNSG